VPVKTDFAPTDLSVARGDEMTPRPNRALGQQLIVLLPTLVVSFVLGQFGLPPVPRIAASLGFGAVLIAGLALIRR
jgi:hypothetical protein